jgi:hypothetical protein
VEFKLKEQIEDVQTKLKKQVADNFGSKVTIIQLKQSVSNKETKIND